MKKSLFIVGAFLFSTTAWADAPMPGYIEQCTVEIQKTATTQCKRCTRTPEKYADNCDKTLAAEGYSKRCERQQNGGFFEIWCTGTATPEVTPTAEPKATTPTAVVPPTKQGGCAVSPGESSTDSLWLLPPLGLFLFLRRPRRAP